MTTNELGSRYQVASREKQLVQHINQTLATIRSISENKYFEALAMLQAAGLPTSTIRLNQVSPAVLRSGYELLTNFLADAAHVASIDAPAYWRAPIDVTAMDGGLTATSFIPFSLYGADGNIYDAFMANGATSGMIFGAYEQSNKTGSTTNFIQIQVSATDFGHATLLSDREVIMRAFRAGSMGIHRCGIDASGAPVINSTVIANLVNIVGINRPNSRDYTDGRYLWCVTQSTVGVSIRVHKINLATGVEEGYRTITATAAGVGVSAVFAYGDDAVVLVEDAAGVVRATYFTIADGSGAGASSTAAAGTALQTPGTNEVLSDSILMSAPFSKDAGGVYTGLRLFLTQDGTDPSEAQQRIDIYPAQGAAGNVQADILGYNLSEAAGATAITRDGRYLLVFDGGMPSISLYDVERGEELQTFAILAITSVVRVVSANASHILVNTTQGAGETVLAVKVN